MPVKTMAIPARVGGGDHLGVAHRAAGLDDGRGARLGDRRSSPSAKGKKASDATSAPLCQRRRQAGRAGRLAAFQAAIRAASTRLICPAPMPTVAPPLA